MLSKKNQEYFRVLLNEKLNALLEEANKTVVGMTDHGETFPDPTDRATLESERNFTLRIRDRERKLISKSRRPWTGSIRGPLASVKNAARIFPKRDSRRVL